MSVLNVAIIGFGIGRMHLEGYRALPGLYDVRAVVDLDPARRSAAAEFGVPETPADIAAVLGRGDIAVVDICTPPATHLALAQAALAAGHHVVCEKPLVGSLAECDRLGEAARRARGVLMPVFQYRWGDGLRRLQRLVARGVTGPLHAATVETHWRRGADYYAVPWRGRFATELGGCLTTHAIHAHDMLRLVAGEYAEVFALTATRINPIEVEDCAAAAARMASGALVTLSVTLGAAKESSRLRFVFGNLLAESSLAPYAPGDDPWSFTPADDATAARIEEEMAGFEPAPARFAGQFAAFHAALATGAPPPVTWADARASLELLTALYHSAATGQRVMLPIGAGHPAYAGWDRVTTPQHPPGIGASSSIRPVTENSPKSISSSSATPFSK
jgi:predicted dehydrogenase